MDQLTAPLQRSLISPFGVRRMTDTRLRVLDAGKNKNTCTSRLVLFSRFKTSYFSSTPHCRTTKTYNYIISHSSLPPSLPRSLSLSLSPYSNLTHHINDNVIWCSCHKDHPQFPCCLDESLLTWRRCPVDDAPSLSLWDDRVTQSQHLEEF